MSALRSLFFTIVRFCFYPVLIVYSIICLFLEWIGLKKIDFNHDDQLVLITGSGNGLGRELALHFAASGASLVLWDIDEDGNNETQKQCLKILSRRNRSARVRSYKVDLTQSSEVQLVAERVRQEFGQISILVLNAGFVSGKSLLNESNVEIERTFSVNCLSSIWLLKAFLPYMIDANRGRIIFVASILGVHCCHGPVTYVASKHAAVGLSRSLRMDVHAAHPKSSISVHCVCPYLMRTKMFEPMVDRVSWKFLFPIVTPKFVAEQTLSAIYWNRDEIILPYHLKYFGLLNQLFVPSRIAEWLLFKVSTRQPLDFFRKRPAQNLSKQNYFSTSKFDKNESMEKSFVCVD